MPDMKPIRVGAARVALLNAGDMSMRLAEELAVPESAWRPLYADLFDQSITFPSLSVYIELGDVKLLVDANDYRTAVTPESGYALDGYTPPPDIPAQLASLGARPEDITHMVITHAHWDHFAGATTPADGEVTATFPQARYYLGAADWDDAELQKALLDPESLESRTLGALHERGALSLVAGRERIAEGIEILPAPGETPGHQIVRVHSEGETLYVVGDLFHHAIEVTHPDWMVTWADVESMRATRRWLMDDALAERALLIAAHIANPGRLERADDGIRWVEA